MATKTATSNKAAKAKAAPTASEHHQAVYGCSMDELDRYYERLKSYAIPVTLNKKDAIVYNLLDMIEILDLINEDDKTKLQQSINRIKYYVLNK